MRKMLAILMFVVAFSAQSQQSTQHDDATSLTGDPSNGALVLPDACPSANPGDRCYISVGDPPAPALSAVPDCNQNQSYCNKYATLAAGQCSAYFQNFSVQPSGGLNFTWSLNTNDNYSLANAANSYSMSINAAKNGLGTSYATLYLTTTKIADGTQNYFSWSLSLTCQTR